MGISLSGVPIIFLLYSWGYLFGIPMKVRLCTSTSLGDAGFAGAFQVKWAILTHKPLTSEALVAKYLAPHGIRA